MIIYLARNCVNLKCYVGKTERSLTKRWQEHRQNVARGSMQAFCCAIRKHGVDAFELSVLQECSDKAEMDAAEIRWIAELGTFGTNGYNMTAGGDGGSLPGRVVSTETRVKIAEVAKKRYAEGHGLLMRSHRKKGTEHPFAGKSWGRKGPHTEEAKVKMSLAHTGKILSEEHKAAISAGCTGKPGPKKGTEWSEAERQKHTALRYLKKKPVFAYDVAGVCVFAYLSVDDARIETGLGHRVLVGNRKAYKPKYVNGVTFKRSELTIGQLKEIADDGLPRQ